MPTLNCVIVNFRQEGEAFTFPREQNEALWKNLAGMKANARAKLANVTVNVIAIEGSVDGYDIDDVRAELNAALKDLPEVKIVRGAFEAYLEEVPQNHAPIATLVEPTAEPTPGDTMVNNASTSETRVTKPAKGPPKTLADMGHGKKEGPTGDDAASAAKTTWSKWWGSRR